MDGGVLILQVKQALRSALEEYGGCPQPDALRDMTEDAGEGARVVGLQRILQAYSDPFLGPLLLRPLGALLPCQAVPRYEGQRGAGNPQWHVLQRLCRGLRGAILDWSNAYEELSLAD